MAKVLRHFLALRLLLASVFTAKILRILNGFQLSSQWLCELLLVLIICCVVGITFVALRLIPFTDKHIKKNTNSQNCNSPRITDNRSVATILLFHMLCNAMRGLQLENIRHSSGLWALQRRGKRQRILILICSTTPLTFCRLEPLCLCVGCNLTKISNFVVISNKLTHQSICFVTVMMNNSKWLWRIRDRSLVHKLVVNPLTQQDLKIPSYCHFRTIIPKN